MSKNDIYNKKRESRFLLTLVFNFSFLTSYRLINPSVSLDMAS